MNRLFRPQHHRPVTLAIGEAFNGEMPPQDRRQLVFGEVVLDDDIRFAVLKIAPGEVVALAVVADRLAGNAFGGRVVVSHPDLAARPKGPTDSQQELVVPGARLVRKPEAQGHQIEAVVAKRDVAQVGLNEFESELFAGRLPEHGHVDIRSND